MLAFLNRGKKGASAGKSKASSRRETRGASRKSGVSGSAGSSGAPTDLISPKVLVIVSVFLLVILGLLMIYSASSIVALKKFDDPAHYLKRQAIYAAIGVIALIVLAKIPYRVYGTYAVWAIWIVTVLLLLYTIAKGLDAKGASRWISIFGVFSLQPSEFAKITILLLAANLLNRYRDGDFDFSQFMVFLGLGVVFPLILVMLQPDLGTTIIIVTTVIIMLYLGGMPARYIGYMLIAMAVLVAFAILLKPYRLRRLITVFNPWADPMGNGYQPIQGMYAFGSGGLFGVGLGNSRQKFLYLPEAHTDFIYAIIGEELGLIGTLFVLALFIVLIYAGIRITAECPDFIGRMIGGGVTSIIAVQAIINIMCVIGFFPVTGKPLPFLSYGGSSIITSLMLIGLLLAVANQKPQRSQADIRRDSLTVISMDEGPRSSSRPRAKQRGGKSRRTQGRAGRAQGRVQGRTAHAQR